LARTAAECQEVGAAMIHLHVRKPDGSHLLDANAYKMAIDAVRKETAGQMIIQITSEALGIYSPAQQRAVVQEVKPEAVSLALRELVPDESEEAAFADFLRMLKRESVMPQIILYSVEEADRLENMAKRGLIP